MSRWMTEKIENGKITITEEIAYINECRYLVNEVCANPDSEACCDFPSPDEYCSKCPYFLEEEEIGE